MILTRSIALLSFLVSQVTIAISYYVALQYDHPKVESCNPFFGGCLNITDAGIYSPEGFIFRGGMIAACAFFIMWWIASFERISIVVNKITILNSLSTLAGIVGAICLIVATAVLIPPRDVINWDLHVAGAVLFFLVTFFAQLLHCSMYHFSNIKETLSKASWITKVTTVLTQGIMILIVLNKDSIPHGEEVGNAIEWWLALLIAIYFLTGFWDWKEQPQVKQN